MVLPRLGLIRRDTAIRQRVIVPMPAFQPVSRRKRVLADTIRVVRILLGLGKHERVIGFPASLAPSLIRGLLALMPRIDFPELLKINRIRLVHVTLLDLVALSLRDG